MAKNGTKYLENVQSFSSTDKVGIMNNVLGGTVRGSFTGLAAGLMFAFFFKKSYFVCGSIGAVGGGIATFVVTKALTRKKKESEEILIIED